MKKYVLIAVGYMVLFGVIGMVVKQKDTMEEKWQTAASNVKAYDKLLGKSGAESMAYQLTIDQLEAANDSVLQELDATRRKLKVKGKDLKAVAKVSSSFIKTDTLILQDTIFKEVVKDRPLSVDTLLGDEWYKAKIQLKYPSTVVFQPSFKSDKDIVVSLRKETVDPPKKCWLLRLFQKKHKVVEVTVTEKNPYVTNQQCRYVEIIK